MKGRGDDFVSPESDLLKGNYSVEGRLEWKVFWKNARFLLLNTNFLYLLRFYTFIY